MTTSESRNPELKSCYLAGPMRGYPQYNFPAFHAAAESLRERCYEVWSPAENDVHEDGFNPATDAAQPMRHYMKRDLPAVLAADFVAVLPGWEKSQGAQLEVHVARTCGIPVLNAGDLSPAIASETAHPDSARLDWLDRMNQALNKQYGTQYGWKLILSPNVNRLMVESPKFGELASIDLNDTDGGQYKYTSVRAAIDEQMRSRPERGQSK